MVIWLCETLSVGTIFDASFQSTVMIQARGYEIIVQISIIIIIE